MWWTALAWAGSGTLLVGVESVDVLDGLAARCFRSSRVCLVDGVPPEALRHRPGVRYVENDRVMALAGAAVQGSVACPDLHELTQIDVVSAWSVGRGAGALVAVQDAGFRVSHTDLVGRIARGWDYGDGDARPEVSPADVPEHGTFVAGIVAATDDGVGRTGVAPEAQLFVQKIADRTGALYFSYAIAAMDDLVLSAPDVRVLNYSIASLDPPRAFEDAVVALGTADVLLVTAAANCPVPDCGAADNDANPVYPASYPFGHVVAVASQVRDGTLDAYSHFGASSVALAAPGAEVCSLGVQSDDDWTVASGTSYATPVVAGVAALVRQAFPRLSAEQTGDLLCGAAQAVPDLVGKVACGALDAGAAVATPVFVVADIEGPSAVVGDPIEVQLAIDNLAGSGPVTVSVEGDGMEPIAVEVVLAADASTDVWLPWQATGAGDHVATVTVSGTMGDVVQEVAWLARDGSAAVDTADTADLADTGPAAPSDDLGPQGTAPSPATEGPDAAGCGCSSSRAPSWPWLGVGLVAMARRARRGFRPEASLGGGGIYELW